MSAPFAAEGGFEGDVRAVVARGLSYGVPVEAMAEVLARAAEDVARATERADREIAAGLSAPH